MKNIFIVFCFILLYSCQNNSKEIVENSEKIEKISQENIFQVHQNEQEKIHQMETNFPVLNIFSHENLVIPKDYSFSGNILISEY